MGKSLFRFIDRFELCITYFFCFSLNLMFDYVKTLDLESYILKSFLENFMDYQILINFLFTFIVLVFHYQMLHRKKEEIYCRILVGDTILNIAIRYTLECLMILGFVYLLSIVINVYLNFNLTSNLYLVCIFVIYILISSSQVRKYENF
ncbi:hypothetical protein [Hathewaya limosa]|uniref:Uncharacterized protein n=1 Tax=Hathewaya limosa TaxID=1536 RepID=A0ABU0JT51_HATLI|nr:hypothetical protein [Hathewaya limosa]MDQ0480277.1 hypothetical protein [Hathewaya limosa]